MWLINTETYKLKEKYGNPKYAILSHTWVEGEETSFRDVVENTNMDKPGYNKVVKCCQLARRHGYDWAWCDTCCINKESSAELSEAINSMFKWYQEAGVCYVFLNDRDLTSYRERPIRSDCRWFKRGWTLQELLAPSNVEFYEESSMNLLGTKRDLAGLIADATGIDVKYLLAETPLRSASIAKRMSWAAQRSTTRTEDEAYCLIGLFDVNMPLLLEIISQSDDDSIFAWAAHWSTVNTGPYGLLAWSPALFAGSGNIKRSRYGRSLQLSTVARKGIYIHRTAVPFYKSFQSLTGLPDNETALTLQCGEVSRGGHFRRVVLYLKKDARDPNAMYQRVGVWTLSFGGYSFYPYFHNWLATVLYQYFVGAERLLLDLGFSDSAEPAPYVEPELWIDLRRDTSEFFSVMAWGLWAELLLWYWAKEEEPDVWELLMTFWMLWKFAHPQAFALHSALLAYRLRDFQAPVPFGLLTWLEAVRLWLVDHPSRAMRATWTLRDAIAEIAH